MEKEKIFVSTCIEQKASRLISISKQIWEFAELGYQEFQSAEVLIKALEEEEFKVTKNLTDIPTAFKGVWGKGSPVIGVLGEFDALPGLSQKAAYPIRSPIQEGKPGHGCGHNLLGTGALAGAIAIKEYLKKTKQSGTIIFFGTPAEENLSGKAFMARDGAFKGVDFFYTWHPSPYNRVGAVHLNGNISRIYQFKGVASHAGVSPQLGRSALDSCELMDVGVNYLREHVIMQARIHYAYIDIGGHAPNIVQDHAALRYTIRAPYLRQVREIVKRVDDVAKGAALMCGTKVYMFTEAGYSEYIPNNVLASVADWALHEIGVPQWDASDYQLAKEFTESFSSQAKNAEREVILERYGKNRLEEKLEHPLDTVIDTYDPSHMSLEFGSTDVGDVGYIAPTVHFNVATEAIGTQGHSWQKAGQANSSIGFKGMLIAGKVIALASIYMLKHPEKVAQAKAEFLKKNDGIYDCPVADVRERPSL